MEAEAEGEAEAVAAQQLRLLVAAGASDLDCLTLGSSGALYMYIKLGSSGALYMYIKLGSSGALYMYIMLESSGTLYKRTNSVYVYMHPDTMLYLWSFTKSRIRKGRRTKPLIYIYICIYIKLESSGALCKRTHSV